MFRTLSIVQSGALALICFGLPLHSGANSCKDFVASNLGSQESSSHFRIPEERLVQVVEDWVLSHETSPSLKELAGALEVSVQQLTKVLGQRSGEDGNNGSFRESSIQTQIQNLIAVAKQKNPEAFAKLERQYAFFAARFMKDRLRMPSLSEASEAMGIKQTDLRNIFGASKGALIRIREYAPEQIGKIERRIIMAFIGVVTHFNRTPTLAELAEKLEVPEKDLQSLFGSEGLFKNLQALQAAAFREKPKVFENYIDTRKFSENYKDNVLQLIQKAPRIIVTSAVGGSVNRLGQIEIPRVEMDFLDALIKFSETNGDIPIVVKPINGMILDPALAQKKNVWIFPWGVEFDKYLALNHTEVQAKDVNPLVGLDRMGPRGQRQIIAAAKSMQTTISTFNNHLHSHQLYTTGAITQAYYVGYRPREKKRASVATDDHYLGALVLEKSMGESILQAESKHGFFHVRRLSYIPEEKGFTHLNEFYTAQGKSPARIEAIAVGDTHVGETDPKLLRPLLDLFAFLNPRYIVLHDIFNGKSVSHWDEKNQNLMIHKFMSGELDLAKELHMNLTHILSVLEASPNSKILIPSANHNSWLRRWLEDRNRDPKEINSKIYFQLKNAVISEGVQDPYAYWIQNSLPSHLRSRVLFLDPGQSFIVGPNHRPVELGQHGDRGDGRATPGLRSFQKALSGAVYGHTHTVQVAGNIVNMGTTTPKELAYTVGGFSKWVQAVSVIDEHGAQTVLEFTYGEWLRNKPLPSSHENNFFREGYPKVQAPDSNRVLIIDPDKL